MPAAVHAVTLVGWDIPVTTATSASVSGDLASGVSATSIARGSGLTASSSSTSWRLAGLNNSTSFITETTGANALGDYFQWTLTTSARTTASITGSTGFLWTASGTLPSNSAQLWYSRDAGSSWNQLGTSVSLGASEVDVGASWFSSPLNLGAGTSTIFRAAPLGATGGATSPKIAWNAGASAAQDAVLTGTTGGGAYNLVWNGGSGSVTTGQSGLFSGTDAALVAVSNPTFEAGDNVTMDQSGTMNVVAGGVTFGNLIDSNASGATAIAGGNITAGSLQKTGLGTLTLTGSNAFSGGTISAGKVIAGSSDALGNSAMTINGGTISVINSAVTSLVVPLTVGSSGATIDHANPLTLSAAIAGSGNILTKTNSGSLTLSGLLGSSGAGVQVNVEAGSLILSGGAKEFANASVFNGDVTISSTTVNLSQSSSFAGTGRISTTGTSTINARFNSLGGTKTISNPMTLGGTLTLTAGASRTLLINGVLAGTGDLTTSGSGAVRLLSAEVGTFSGTLTVSSSGTSASTEVSTQALGSATSVVLTPNASYAGTNGTLQITNAAAHEFSGVISGGGSIGISSGTKRATLSGNNTFTGGSVVKGDVGIGHVRGLGVGTINASGTGGRVFWDGAASSATLDNVINTGTASTDMMSFSPGSGKTLTLSGKISGTGILKVSSGGDLVVANATNDYAGGTEIGTGRLFIANDSALGSGSVNFSTSSGSHLVAGANITSATRNFTIGNSFTANLDTQGNRMSIGGVISDKIVGDSGKLNKLGEGVLTLSGTNTYTGTTTISGGTLALSATGSINQTPSITVAATATFDVSALAGGYSLSSGQVLSGAGRVAGAANISGTLSPGSSPGKLETDSQVWLNGGDYNWQMLDASAAAGIGYDTIAVTGTLDLSSLSTGGFGINLWSLGSVLPDANGDALNFNHLLSQSWTLLTTTQGITGFESADFTISSTANNGTGGFSNLLDSNGIFSLGQSGNDLMLSYTVIPEPCVSLLGSLGLLLALRRRRG